VSTDIHDTGSIPMVTPEGSGTDWAHDTLAQRFDTLPEAVKAHRAMPLFMDAPPQQAEPAPVVVPASYPSSDADSFFDRTWFETGAIDVSELRGGTEVPPMRVGHVTVTPSAVDPIAASLAAEHGVELPEPTDTLYHAPDGVSVERPVDERPVFERPLYEAVAFESTQAFPVESTFAEPTPVVNASPGAFDDSEGFFETAPVVGAPIQRDFDPSLLTPRPPVTSAVTVESLAASFEEIDTSRVDRTSEFESYYADARVDPTPAYSAETPGDAWYVEPPFIKGEGIVPVKGAPSRWAKLLVPIALGAVAVMALIAGWTHFQNGNSDATIVVAPTNQPAASTAPTIAPVVPEPAASTAPTVAPVVPTPAASTSAPTPVVTAGDRSVPVVVLNGSGKSGLAAKVAADLRAKGWKVLSVGNYAGTTQTTVYSPGPRTASLTMRQDVPQASLTHKPLPGMSKSHITLVLGSDYSA
jgi:hypothetical protein